MVEKLKNLQKICTRKIPEVRDLKMERYGVIYVWKNLEGFPPKLWSGDNQLRQKRKRGKFLQSKVLERSKL